MPQSKKSPSSKRTSLPREVDITKKFVKDWERLERSGKQDMNRLKEAMLLLIANDAPLPSEWKDHGLSGPLDNVRECHVKGDLLLVYEIDYGHHIEGITFLMAGTHSEIFGR